MTTPDDNLSRARLVTFITTFRDTLKINPYATAQQFCEILGCAPDTGEHLVALGVITTAKDGLSKWVSTETPDEIADKIIVRRRPTAPPPAIISQAELDGFKKHIAALEQKVKDLEERKPPQPKLSDDDAELLGIAVNDYASAAARIQSLEAALQRVLYQQASAPAGKASAAPVRKIVVGIIGVYPRDLSHIHAKGVELRHIEHGGGHFAAIPAGLDAVIVTDDAQKKWRDVQSAYPRASYRVTGGNKSIINQLNALAGNQA